MDYFNVGKNIISSEIDHCNTMLSHLNSENYNMACNILQSVISKNGRIITTGIGKSGYIAAKFASTLSSTNSPAFFIHPSEASHGDLGMITKNDCVVAFSNSGETEELFNILNFCKKINIPIISITKNKNSTLGKFSTVVIDYFLEREACLLNLAPTSSTSIALMISDSIAVALYYSRNFVEKDFKNLHPGGKLGKKLLTSRDVMIPRDYVVTAEPDHIIENILINMSSGKLGGIIFVTDCDHILHGIVTDGDLRRHILKNILKKPIKSIMNTKPIVLHETLLAVECLNIMKENRITALPVVENNNVFIGMVHVHDLLKLNL